MIAALDFFRGRIILVALRQRGNRMTQNKDQQRLRLALMKCAAALQVVTGTGEFGRVRFTGKWRHLGSATIKEILDEADAVLEP